MKKHQHRIHTTSDALPFFGPVNDEKQNPAAHGGCRFVDRCRCGAERETLSNGGHIERGAWYMPAEND